MRLDIGLLALRIVGGFFMLLLHGWPKLANYAQMSTSFGDPLGIGSTASLILTIFAEVLCALFVLLGIATRWASIPLAITMGVAGFIVHGADPLARKELALVYLFVYIALFCLGGGRYGFDNLIKRARN